MNLKKWMLLLFTVLLCLALAACGAAEPEGEAGEGAAEEAAEETADGTRVITDFYGNEVEVPAEVTSIITGKTVVTQLVALVGGTDCLASLGEGFNYQDGMLCKELFPGLDDLPELKDNDMNVESLLELSPDVVLISSPSPDGTDVGNLLKESGLPVVYYNLANSEDLKHAVRMIAEIIGTDEAAAKAEQYVEFYEKAMSETAEAAAASAEQPTAAYSRGARGICGPNSMPGEWMTALNAKNVADDLGITAFNAEVTVEEFLNVDPDIIFCEGPQAVELLQDPQYEGLKAVQNGAVYNVPYGLACSALATAENPIAWYYAANILHPDVCEYDMDAIVADFFQTFYGYELSQEQIDTILNK
ncbi:MAG: ABC transporter substrate-binding protein [Firmicutes bacterium]|nr:ABC transporter substrate-binding protein [Bacillota bacterium]